ncbi:MAG: bifunctional phosphopantothenoylcysteine decarboxylase/phosphopantothenate--cysteine ligase CoaBC [Candidatus Hermodarchaeota archaeon]|nr:bifunctional phosphopantothenoylcysteine decarboxylase/phosphopantothenate--cysteine ligase CoaBC [Candidatus Hermodarchaeota archaeon]
MQKDHPSMDIVESLGTELRGKTIVICVTGSVAAVQSPEIARLLMRHGADVIAVFSEAAHTIIHPYLMEWATGNPVIMELTGKIEHVALAGEHKDKADLILIAPATANTISKVAMGIDDTPVTSTVTTAFGSGIPIIIVPAMHASMYKHPILGENITNLKKLGVEFIGPRMEEGKAKIASPAEVVKAVLQKLGAKHDFTNKRILVTAGPTIEYIDPVRIVTSKSSGRMGIELARAAFDRGAKVTLVYGRGSITPPEGVHVVAVETTQEMLDAVKTELQSKTFDVMISAAAVADWTPKSQQDEKIPTSNAKSLLVEFTPTPKIVDMVKTLQKHIFLVLFKAEHGVTDEELVTRAHRRLQSANADLIIANDVSRPGVGFETDTNELFVVDPSKKVVKITMTLKSKAAHQVLDAISNRILRG